MQNVRWVSYYGAHLWILLISRSNEMGIEFYISSKSSFLLDAFIMLSGMFDWIYEFISISPFLEL